MEELARPSILAYVPESLDMTESEVDEVYALYVKTEVGFGRKPLSKIGFCIKMNFLIYKD